MWVEHVLTAQNKMAIWTRGVLWELDTRYVRVSYQVYVDAVPHTISTSSVRESILYNVFATVLFYCSLK